jgi:hypothetical protein
MDPREQLLAFHRQWRWLNCRWHQWDAMPKGEAKLMLARELHSRTVQFKREFNTFLIRVES